VIDRSEWKGRNLFMASIMVKKRAIPVYWVMLPKKGSSSLAEQKQFLKPVLRLLKPMPIVVLGDREFQSVQLGKWLSERGIAFIFRQKKSTYVQLSESEQYQPFKQIPIRLGQRQFFSGIYQTQAHKLVPFNLAIRWKRPSKGKRTDEPWYLLTNLTSLKETLQLYSARFGIEAMFKDCKTGGYNLEQTKVSEPRFLAIVLLIAMSYYLNTLRGQQLNKIPHRLYICRIKESHRSSERHSDFWISTYGTFWVQCMDIFSNLAFSLMYLKRGKTFYFSQGLRAMSLIQQAF
jgi:hypothetical protein